MKKQQITYEWPRPAVTVDVVLFSVAGQLQDLRLQVLLIQRDLEPWRGGWALPGGFVHENEDLQAAAARELAEETGAHVDFLEQVGAVGTPGRDPRGHTVTVVYVALVPKDQHSLQPTGDARAARWFDVAGPEPLPPMAFDHAELLQLALKHLRERVRQAPVYFNLLPAEFTLSELQTLAEVLLGREMDRRNFRRMVHELKFLDPLKRTRREGSHRPAQLYRFVPSAFERHIARTRALPF